MKRLLGEMMVACAMLGVVLMSACSLKSVFAEQPPAQKKGDVEPPPARLSQPVIFDPFATPFAVVDANPDETCVPKADRDKWVAVPPASYSNEKGDSPKDDKPGDVAPPNDQDPDRLGTRARDQKGVVKPVRPSDQKSGPDAGLRPRQFGPGIPGYCVYKWRNQRTLPTRRDFDRIGAVPDSAIIASSQPSPDHIPTLPKSVWIPLTHIFQKQAIGIDPTQWRNLLQTRLNPKKEAVRVAVVDATPKPLDLPDTSLHGLVVSRVIGTLMCGDVNGADCKKRVRPYLALPLVSPDKAGDRGYKEDLANGGYGGTFFHLADALRAALDDLKRDKGHLVINLSLGWEPIKLDRGDKNEARVISLLERASCMGALIVAAAGNPTGTEGALRPGIFEEFPAPGEERCKAFGLPAPPASHAADRRYRYAPLVHSVGALDTSDQRMFADRQWAQPRLAALGMNVSVPGPSEKIPYTFPMSGTSMSTAIVSGIAAAVWSVRPDLDAAGVMALVYQGGVELDGGSRSKRARTEFCMGEHFGTCEGPNQKVHRAYLCGAISEALKQTVPPAKLDCDRSLSSESPVWPTPNPKNPASPVSAPVPCRVPACGMPLGPSSTHLFSLVNPHSGGVAGCPGCTMTVTASGGGLLEGIPSRSNTPGAVRVLLDVVDESWSSQSYLLPTPTFNQQMAIPVQVPPATFSAILTFFYETGGAFSRSDPHDPPIDLQVIPK